MVQIVIDTDTVWKSIKTPITIAGILILIILAAFAGYNAGKRSHVNATFNITPMSGYTVQNFMVDGVSLAPDSMITFPDKIVNHTINITFGKNLCSRLYFTNQDLKSPDVRYFNDGNLIPMGTYTLDVKGWVSPWDDDKDWYEYGVREPTHYKTAAWNVLTDLQIDDHHTPLSTLVTGSFDHEKSTGSAIITLSTPSRVGILINDSTYTDNRGSVKFVFRDPSDTVCGYP
jgi:hypothetical protein